LEEKQLILLIQESMLIKKGRKIVWDNLNYENPKDVVRALTTTLLPYQNRVKRYIIKNL